MGKWIKQYKLGCIRQYTILLSKPLFEKFEQRGQTDRQTDRLTDGPTDRQDLPNKSPRWRLKNRWQSSSDAHFLQKWLTLYECCSISISANKSLFSRIFVENWNFLIIVEISYNFDVFSKNPEIFHKKGLEK